MKENEPRKKDICTGYRFVHDKYFTGKLYWSWPPVQLSGSIRRQFECSVLLLPAFWLHICKLGAQLPDLNERLRSYPLRQQPSERVKTHAVCWAKQLCGKAACPSAGFFSWLLFLSLKKAPTGGIQLPATLQHGQERKETSFSEVSSFISLRSSSIEPEGY